MHSSLSDLIPASLTLVAVLGLVVLGGRAARFSGLARHGLRRSGAGQLLLRDSLALDRVRRLHVVRWNGRDWLLLTGGASDQVIGRSPVEGQDA